MPDSFTRSRLLLGSHNLLKLEKSHVMVIGLGGVGSYAVEALARSGIGRISLVDGDRIEISNINRQIPALHSTVGQSKTDACESRLMDINPDLVIRKYEMDYNHASSAEILADGPDFVADAIDALASKLHLIQACLNRSIPVISSMGMANRLDPSCIRISDIGDTHTCPVARKLRRELKKAGIEAGLPVVFSTEIPIAISRQEGEDSELGSVAFVPSVAGLFIAAHIVRHICGICC